MDDCNAGGNSIHEGLRGVSVDALLRALDTHACLVDVDLRIIHIAWPWVEPPVGRTLAGMNLLDVLAEPDRSRFEAVAATVLGMAAIDGRIVAQDLDVTPRGSAAAMRVAVSPVRGGDGTAVALLCLAVPVDADPCHDSEQDDARLDVARQLAATLNHEINNPLFVISATLEDLLAEAPDAAAERRLHAALESVWRVSSAVKQLTEIRQIISTAYIGGRPMIDLEASQQPRDPRP